MQIFFTNFFPYTLTCIARISSNAVFWLPQKTRQARDACIRKSRYFFSFFISCNLTFSLMNAQVYVNIDQGIHSVLLEHFVEHNPLFSEEWVVELQLQHLKTNVSIIGLFLSLLFFISFHFCQKPSCLLSRSDKSREF